MQLTKEQRYTIQILSNQNYSNIQIADLMGVHKTTIGRELKRNINSENKYCSQHAHAQCEKRHQDKPKKIYLTEKMETAIIKYIKKDYSPEQIKGYHDLKGRDMVSHERIYQYVWDDKAQGGILHTHLRCNKKTYKKRGKGGKKQIIQNRVDISERPKIVDKKERFGDLEIDTIVSKDRENYLLTINDRYSRFFWMVQTNTKDSHLIAKKTIEILMPLKAHLHTITSDNGTEFAQHESIAKALEIDFYFARPYHSSDRGANENTNGLIRQYYPKNSNFTGYDLRYLQDTTEKINTRPRKCLGFLSPAEVLEKLNLQV